MLIPQIPPIYRKIPDLALTIIITIIFYFILHIHNKVQNVIAFSLLTINDLYNYK